MTPTIHLKLPQWAVDNVVLVNVRLDDTLLTPMILDTGAKYTVITPQIAKRLRIELANARRIPVFTATRLESVPLITMGQIDVHGLIVEDIEAAVMLLPAGLGVGGLLGMSFLKHCRMILDIPGRVLELSAV